MFAIRLSMRVEKVDVDNETHSNSVWNNLLTTSCQFVISKPIILPITTKYGYKKHIIFQIEHYRKHYKKKQFFNKCHGKSKTSNKKYKTF